MERQATLQVNYLDHIALYFDSQYNLYVLDCNNCRVMKYALGATSRTSVAGSGTCGSALNEFDSSAQFLFVDSSNNVYISDSSSNRVVRWAAGGSIGLLVTGNGTGGGALNELNFPNDVWVDSSSNIFIADIGNQRVIQWSSGATTGIVVPGVTGMEGKPNSNKALFDIPATTNK